MTSVHRCNMDNPGETRVEAWDTRAVGRRNASAIDVGGSV